jgi:uncharacterized protein
LFETDFLSTAMIINLFELSEPELDFDFELSPSEINLEDDEARLEKPVKISGKLRKGIAQVDVSGRISGEAEINCTRCLSPTKTPLDFEFKASFVTAENYTQDEEAELRADDLDVDIFEGDKIDLTDLAREQILLNLPTHFFCREDCKGLCPDCGVNHNNESCGCEKTEIDPRWAALKNLKNE